jgi:hypothetical protein
VQQLTVLGLGSIQSLLAQDNTQPTQVGAYCTSINAI